MRLLLGLLVVLVPIGCRHAGPPTRPATATAAASAPALPELVDEIRSGTRLKAVWAAAAGDEGIAWAWFDSKLAVNCRFREAGDGRLRCLPMETLATSNVYSDSNCTAPVISTYRVPQTPYYQVSTASSCPARTVVGRIGQALPSDRTFVRRRSESISQSGKRVYQMLGCEPAAANGGPTYALGEPIPPEEFVGATPHTEAGSQRVVPQMLEAEDGARQFWSWFDTGLKVSCMLRTGADGQLRCLPRTPVSTSTAFSDDQCTIPAGTTNEPSACESTEFVVVETPGACPSRYATHRGGRRLSTAYQDVGGNKCLTSSEEHYEVGAEVPAAELPAIASTTWHRPGAALAVELVGPPGKATRSALKDPGLGLPCQPRTCNGDTRCVPDSPQIVGKAYADPQCQQPLAAVRGGTCPPRLAALDPFAALGTPENSSCAAATFYVVGGRHSGPVYRRLPRMADVLAGKMDGEFECRQAPAPSRGGEFYRTERKLTRTDFVKLTFEKR